MMKCPRCESTQLRKNGRSNGKQRYLCKGCGKQFLDSLSTSQVLNVVSKGVSVARNGKTKGVLDETALSKLKVPEASLLQLEETVASSQFNPGIAILLLDAENLKLDIKAETFLASFCNYPLQVKIAFANWRNNAMGKQDAELFERGYQLIHVPGGQNSADAQMITVGVSISHHYPNAKEVLVCSSDWLLTNLCNSLQSQGLTVHRVRRQDNTLSIENRNTGDNHHYSLTIGTEIPSYEKFVQKIEELIHAEQVAMDERMAQLSTIAILFQERRNLTQKINRSNGLPRVEEEQGSISPNLEDESTPSVSGFKAVESKALPETIVSDLTTINSIEALEKVLIAMIETRLVEAELNCIPVTNLKQEFQAKYKEMADVIVKKFQPNSSLIKLLRSRPTVFKLTLEGKEHQVAIAQPQA